MTLEEWLPYEFLQSTFDKRILKHLNDEVISEKDGRYEKWLGKHKNVLNWCTIEGYAVGRNESPSIGWSFIIKKITK